MVHKQIFPLYMLLIVLLLTACTPSPAASDRSITNKPADDHVLDIPTVAHEEVRISRNLQTGSINPSVYGKIEGQEVVDAFHEAYDTASKFEGELDVGRPNYDVVYESDGKTQALHLWLPRLGVGEGMLMEVADTSTGYVLTSDTTKKLKEIIGGIRYDSKQAAANGDVVQFLNRIENYEAWERFMQSVDEKNPDSVHHVAYTIEGDPLFMDIDFDGQQIHYKYDATHDRFGSSETAFVTCEKVVDEPLSAEFGGPGTLYRLGGCTGSDGLTDDPFWFPVPDDVQK